MCILVSIPHIKLEFYDLHFGIDNEYYIFEEALPDKIQPLNSGSQISMLSMIYMTKQL